MKIVFRPQLSQKSLRLERDGSRLIFNGEALDMSDFNGPTPRDEVDIPWIAGDLWSEGGHLVVPVKLPHTQDTADAARAVNPVIDPPDGLIIDNADIEAPEQEGESAPHG